jgi:6-pyruvoyltetrahydropterin/6-carboxytetrahydropterin synthase
MKQRKISITKVFTFDSAHHLNNYNGKCKNVHGHTYKLEVTVKGVVDPNGLVIDFHDLDDMVKNNVLDTIDHRYLNEVFEFNPTCENIGIWIWQTIDKFISKTDCILEKIVLWETPTSFITIDKSDMG